MEEGRSHGTNRYSSYIGNSEKGTGQAMTLKSAPMRAPMKADTLLSCDSLFLLSSFKQVRVHSRPRRRKLTNVAAQ
jgi:hypothetical protein